LRFDASALDAANCIPCRMPYITSMFMPRSPGDRPLPVPPDTRYFAFISQFVEIEQDVVFTLEYSVRAAQLAVYQLMGICRAIPPVKPHDKSLHAKFEALLKSLV
jgi:oleate hydratase